MELVDVWGIPIRLVDLLEIGVVAFALYKLYQFMRGTIALQIFIGLMALYAVQVVVTAIDMTILSTLFLSIGEVAVLAVIILFQPEIRRVLLLLGQNPWIRRFVNTTGFDETVSEVAGAVEEMSRNYVGALIVFERSSGLRDYIETGTSIQAKVTSNLLVTIFHGKTPPPRRGRHHQQRTGGGRGVHTAGYGEHATEPALWPSSPGRGWDFRVDRRRGRGRFRGDRHHFRIAGRPDPIRADSREAEGGA